MARGLPIHDDLCLLLADLGQTRSSAQELAADLGVSKRTMGYALALLREEGVIVLRWEGPNDRTIIWVGEDSDQEAPAAHDSPAPASA